MTKEAEYALIRSALAGDGAAIEALVRAHQDSLFGFILRMSGRPDVAEDIVQEAFVRVIKNLHRFDMRFRFSTWLFTIAKRLYVNHRQKQSVAYDSDMVAIQPDGAESPAEIMGNDERAVGLRKMVYIALSELPEPQREIVLLYHQQEWPIADIAAFMSMPEGTVKSHLHRARERMKRTIVERGFFPTLLKGE
jgi:RNA polymerase sigma-70 factor (ECF subfamily)